MGVQHSDLQPIHLLKYYNFSVKQYAVQMLQLLTFLIIVTSNSASCDQEDNRVGWLSVQFKRFLLLILISKTYMKKDAWSLLQCSLSSKNKQIRKKKKIFGVALKYNATLRMSLVDVLGKCLDF